MTVKPISILFLGAENTARSIMAEASMRHHGGERFCAFSAGIHPMGRVHPLTLDILWDHNLIDSDLRSKSWSEFSGPKTPSLDAVVSVCEAFPSETGFKWCGNPVLAQWKVEDPTEAVGSEAAMRQQFQNAFKRIDMRVRLLTSMLSHSVDRATFQKQLQAIGQRHPEIDGALPA
ncbi:Protein-tyrosine-phosphatase [Azospirillaceae bacterium]